MKSARTSESVMNTRQPRHASLVAFICLAVLATACEKASEPELVPSDSSFDSRLKHAQSLVDFKIILPRYLPPSVSQDPDVSVTPPTGVTLTFFPRHQGDSPVIELTQGVEPIDPIPTGRAGGVTSHLVDGTSVSFESGTSGPDGVFIAAIWSEDGLDWEAIFTWEAPTGSVSPSALMEDDARRVIESIISQ